jgi:hypothetical protein
MVFPKRQHSGVAPIQFDGASNRDGPSFEIILDFRRQLAVVPTIGKISCAVTQSQGPGCVPESRYARWIRSVVNSQWTGRSLGRPIAERIALQWAATD